MPWAGRGDLWGQLWRAPGRARVPLGTSWWPLGNLFGTFWGLLGISWGPLGVSWGPLGGLLGPPGRLLRARAGFLAQTWAQEAAQDRQRTILGAQKHGPDPKSRKSSFYEGFVQVGFPAPGAPEIMKRRSGTPPEAFGNTIFGQNRHFTTVLARPRLQTVSLKNAFFTCIS